MLANVWAAFSETAERSPEREAILFEERSLTFGEWRRRALGYGGLFDSLGVRRHDRVLLWMNASPEMACAMLGVWAVGAIAVILDPNSPASHFQHTLATVGPSLIVVGDDDARLPAQADLRTIVPAEVGADGALARPRLSLPTDPASIVFTSGSTGPPKGVSQSHRNLVHACRTVGRYLGYRPDDRIVCTIPWSFDYGYGQILSTAIGGVQQIIPSNLNAIGICEAIDAHRPTVLPIIPPIITYLLQGLSPFRNSELSSIRIVTNTGGTILTPVLEQALEVLPDARFFLNFGLTESYRTSYLDPTLVRQKPTSIGKPIPGVGLVLVREDGSIVDEPNEVGHLVHRGDYIFMGYWGDPESTAESLRPDPLAPANCPNAAPSLFTGDLATMDEEGFFYHTGRIDHQIKSMGVRVSPGEIEELTQASGLVVEVGVFGMPHEMLGEEVWAAVVPVDSYEGEDITVDLTAYARTTMSPHMTPRRFLVLDHPLPKTRTGKIDYVGLKELADRESTQQPL